MMMMIIFKALIVTSCDRGLSYYQGGGGDDDGVYFSY